MSIRFSGLSINRELAKNHLGKNYPQLDDAVSALEKPFLEPGKAQTGEELSLIELLEKQHGMDVTISVSPRKIVGKPAEPLIHFSLSRDGKNIEATEQELRLSQLSPTSLIEALQKSLNALVSPIRISIESLERLLREIR